MLYNFQRKKLYRHLMVGGVLCAAGFGLFSCSDKYDLDSDQPSGLNSIYSYIQQQGNYTKYLQLIDDLGQKDILSKTGSRTLFIADDAAFGRFFASNPWGVKSYDELSLAQKKLLLNTSMVGNPYTTSMLSTASGDIAPVKGEVCRRSSSVNLMDSVMVLSSDDPQGILPQTASFDNLKANKESFVLFADASGAPPILHFSQKFLTGNKLQSTDVDFLYNQPAGTRQADDVYVNNAKVTEANVFCKNGFVHKVDEVILPLDNMAEIIRKTPEMSLYSSIVERFAAVDYDEDLTKSYNNNKDTDYDSVFIKRYYSNRSAGSTWNKNQAFTTDKNGTGFDAALKYDPGWNAYGSGSQPKGDNEMMEDMAVMMVPSNEALIEWWNNGGGTVIKEFYSTLESTPNSTLDDLVRVNQLAALTAALPSTFDQIKDDAQETMVVTTEDIDRVYLGCNGVVYLTNKVFAPRSYSSVLFPTVVDTLHFNIIANAIKHLDYSAYLNSMASEYIFIIPTSNGLTSYIDPVSYIQGEDVQIIEFVPSATKKPEAKDYVVANIYKGVSNGDGTWSKGDKVNRSPITFTMDNSEADGKTNKNGFFKNRFEDLLDNHIIIEPYQEGKKYYKTKGNTFVRVDGIEPGSQVAGSMQATNGQPLTVQTKYPMENGHALVIDGALMGTNNSVAMTLAAHDEFSEFLAILSACGALNTQDAQDKWFAGDNVYGNLFNIKEAGHVGAEALTKGKKATYLLNNYHYTLYAPTNEAMEKAFAMGLPTLQDLAAAEAFDTEFEEQTKSMTDAQKKAYAAEQGTCAGDSAERVQEAMLDFVKYHIQDNSIFIDAGFESGNYETGKTELIKSTATKDNVAEEDLANYDVVEKTLVSDGKYNIVYNVKDDSGTQLYSPGRPYKLSVKVSSSDLSVNGISVDKARGLYNLMAREYWYTSDASTIKNPYECKLNNSSAVVIHGINEPLVYDAPAQFKYTYKKLALSTD